MPQRLGALQKETGAAAPTHSSFGPRQPVCQLKASGTTPRLSPGGWQKPLGTAEARQGEGCAPVVEQRPQHAPTTRRWEERLQRGALEALGRGTELPPGLSHQSLPPGCPSSSAARLLSPQKHGPGC